MRNCIKHWMLYFKPASVQTERCRAKLKRSGEKKKKEKKERKKSATPKKTHTFKTAVFCGLFSGLKIFFTEKHRQKLTKYGQERKHTNNEGKKGKKISAQKSILSSPPLPPSPFCSFSFAMPLCQLSISSVTKIVNWWRLSLC